MQIPLLVLTSGIPDDDVATFIQQLLSEQASLAEGVPAHKVLCLPESTSAAFPPVLSEGLQWLASEAPPSPALMVCPMSSCYSSDPCKMQRCLSLWNVSQCCDEAPLLALLGTSDSDFLRVRLR